MRTFLITSPGLTVGRPGTVVTADKMRMDDDKLDAFVEAGHAVELHGPDPDPRPDDTVPDTLLDDLATLVDDSGAPVDVPDAQPGDEQGQPVAAAPKPRAKKA